MFVVCDAGGSTVVRFYYENKCKTPSCRLIQHSVNYLMTGANPVEVEECVQGSESSGKSIDFTGPPVKCAVI